MIGDKSMTPTHPVAERTSSLVMAACAMPTVAITTEMIARI